MSIQYRSEHDSVGERSVPKDVYYGVQSLRAAENFPITGLAVHPEQINSIAEIKKASRHHQPGDRPAGQAGGRRIVRACDEIAAGRLHEAFIVDPIQGGAGTSLNMNANEVIANRAIELLGGEKGTTPWSTPTTTSTTASPPTMCSLRRASWRCSSCWCGPRSSSSGSLRPWRPRRRSLTTCSRWAARRCRTRCPSVWGRSSGPTAGRCAGTSPASSGPRTRCAASTWGAPPSAPASTPTSGICAASSPTCPRSPGLSWCRPPTSSTHPEPGRARGRVRRG